METTHTDTELVEAWRRGDATALGVVYDRYAPAIHGFALARTRSAADAADVVQDTFVRASSRVHQLREPERLRAWLFAIARRRVYDLASRRDVVNGRSSDERPGQDPPHEAGLVRDEVHELVWAAAGSLTERDQELLELHLREGLDGADLAAVVGLAPSHVNTLLSRLRDRMAKAVGALLVARHARRACPALDAALAGWDGRFTLDVRSRVTRHVEGCAVCADERSALLVPGWFTAGAFALPVALPPELRDRVLGAARRAGPGSDGGPLQGRGSGGWRHDGFPTMPRASRPRGGWSVRWTSVAAVVTGLAVVIATVAVVTHRGDARTAVVETATSGDTADDGGASPASLPDAPGPVAPADTTSLDAPVASPTTSAVPVSVESAGREGRLPGDDGVAADQGSRPEPPGTAAGPATTGSTVTSASAPPVAPSTAAPPPGDPGGVATTTGSTTAPTTTVAAPASIELSTASIALGSSLSSASLTVTNRGGQPATLATASSSATLTVANGAATIAPGSSATLTVALDRAAEAEGARSFTVTITAAGASGGGPVVVTATVEHPPTITSLSRTPATVRTATACGQTLVRVSVDATDESGVASVSVLWSSDGVLGQRTALSLDPAGHWTAQVGSFNTAGNHRLVVEVTDTRGNHVNGSTSVDVVAC